MSHLFGWSDEPLYAEQKLENLFHTVDNTLDTLAKAYQINSPLKASRPDGVEFHAVHGYRVVLKWVPPHLEKVPDILRTRLTGQGSWGYWFVYSNRVGSLGDERHKWPVWDAHMLKYEPLPKGLRTRWVPHDYLGEEFGEVRGFNEDEAIAATIEQNRQSARQGRVIAAEILFGKPTRIKEE